MTSPRFSILIPTRDRQETFVHALATVAAQPGDDFEIVVADNASRPGIRAAVEAITSVPIRYLRSDTALNMDANWERGLDACQGEFITILGDDDGFLPSTLEAVRRILNVTRANLLSWPCHTYWWPDTIVPWNRNTLVVGYGSKVYSADSRNTLVGFMNGSISFGSIPMLYNSFAHRSLVGAIKQKYGTYFPVPYIPDVVSGVLLLSQTGRYALSTRPLAVRGNSGRSQGTSYWCRHLGAKRREESQKDEKSPLEALIHPSLIPSPNLHILLASCRLWCHEVLFPSDEELKVDLGPLVDELVASLNFEPEAYDDNLADVRALAAKLGRAIDPASIPPVQVRPRRPSSGPIADEKGNLTSLAVNGNLAGLQNIHDASRLAEALVPELDTFIRA